MCVSKQHGCYLTNFCLLITDSSAGFSHIWYAGKDAIINEKESNSICKSYAIDIRPKNNTVSLKSFDLIIDVIGLSRITHPWFWLTTEYAENIARSFRSKNH